MVQSACQPLHSLYRRFDTRLSVTKDTLLVVSPQAVATFCKLRFHRVLISRFLRAKALTFSIPKTHAVLLLKPRNENGESFVKPTPIHCNSHSDTLRQKSQSP